MDDRNIVRAVLFSAAINLEIAVAGYKAVNDKVTADKFRKDVMMRASDLVDDMVDAANIHDKDCECEEDERQDAINLHRAIKAAEQSNCKHARFIRKRFEVGKKYHYIDAAKCVNCGLIYANKVIEPPPVASGIPWGDEEKDNGLFEGGDPTEYGND